MTAFEKLKHLNSHITILSLQDSPKHKLFCQVEGDMSAFLDAACVLDPQPENAYLPCDESMTANPAAREIERSVFGELPVQAGWNHGGNTRMNGMEWHQSSEVIVACSDLVLLLGDHEDIKDDVYDASLAFGLYLQKGEAVQLLPLTLHLAPLPVRGGRFIAAILLPRGTNLPLQSGICGTRRAVNKWLLVHPENQRGIALGGKVGIQGENLAIQGLG